VEGEARGERCWTVVAYVHFLSDIHCSAIRGSGLERCLFCAICGKMWYEPLCCPFYGLFPSLLAPSVALINELLHLLDGRPQ
jgi:hypothetical protein